MRASRGAGTGQGVRRLIAMHTKSVSCVYGFIKVASIPDREEWPLTLLHYSYTPCLGYRVPRPCCGVDLSDLGGENIEADDPSHPPHPCHSTFTLPLKMNRTPSLYRHGLIYLWVIIFLNLKRILGRILEREDSA